MDLVESLGVDCHSTEAHRSYTIAQNLTVGFPYDRPICHMLEESTYLTLSPSPAFSTVSRFLRLFDPLTARLGVPRSPSREISSVARLRLERLCLVDACSIPRRRPQYMAGAFVRRSTRRPPQSQTAPRPGRPLLTASKAAGAYPCRTSHPMKPSGLFPWACRLNSSRSAIFSQRNSPVGRGLVLWVHHLGLPLYLQNKDEPPVRQKSQEIAQITNHPGNIAYQRRCWTTWFPSRAWHWPPKVSSVALSMIWRQVDLIQPLY